VFAPNRDWAAMVIDEAAAFPKHRFKDLTDSTTQALRLLRQQGLKIPRSSRGFFLAIILGAIEAHSAQSWRCHL
jgi:hypothetical protein